MVKNGYFAGTDAMVEGTEASDIQRRWDAKYFRKDHVTKINLHRKPRKVRLQSDGQCAKYGPVHRSRHVQSVQGAVHKVRNTLYLTYFEPSLCQTLKQWKKWGESIVT